MKFYFATRQLPFLIFKALTEIALLFLDDRLSSKSWAESQMLISLWLQKIIKILISLIKILRIRLKTWLQIAVAALTLLKHIGTRNLTLTGLKEAKSFVNSIEPNIWWAKLGKSSKIILLLLNI